MMTKPLSGFAALGLMLAAALLPAPALARGRFVSLQGANGRGLVASRSVERQPGSFSADRSVQANDGRGFNASVDRNHGLGHFSSTRSLEANDGRGATTTRNAAWGDGSYAGSKQTVTNDGRSFGRTTSATGNGDGTATYATTLTGPQGRSTSISGTVSHTP